MQSMTPADLAGLAAETALSQALAIEHGITTATTAPRCPMVGCGATLTTWSGNDSHGEPEGGCECPRCDWSPTAVRPFKFQPLGQVATDEYPLF